MPQVLISNFYKKKIKETLIETKIEHKEIKKKKTKKTKKNKALGNNKSSKPQVIKGKNNNFMEHDWYKYPVDKKGRNDKDKDFDRSSIVIPSHIWEKLTPSVKRYWEIKQNYMDCILFYKVGKFYELYDDDAITCHNEIGLNYMGREQRPHVGIPEKTYEKYAQQLVVRGYKIAKVDQVESIKDMKKRTNKKSEPKVVKRELTSVVTPGVNVDLEINDSNDSVYLLSIYEPPSNILYISYGVCFCESNTSTFFIGEIHDDVNRSKLKTLLSQLRPVEIIISQRSISQETNDVIKYNLPINTVVNNLELGTEFWDTQKTISIIEKNQYFYKNRKINEWPNVLKKYKNSELVMPAFGGVIFYLNKLLSDYELISMGRFKEYINEDVDNYLILDGSTLLNLEIFKNLNNSTKNSLFKYVNNCVTAGGHRMFKKWLEYPLKNIDGILERLNAVEDFIHYSDLSQSLIDNLKLLPDMERYLLRIYAYIVNNKNAIKRNIVMYENSDIKYIKLYQELIKSINLSVHCLKLFKEVSLKLSSKLLFDITNFRISEYLENIIHKKYFNNENKFIIKNISNDNYLNILNEIKETKNSFNTLLNKYKNKLQKVDINIKYFSSNVTPYQIEIDIDKIKDKKIPSEFYEVSRTNKKRRFYTSKVEHLIEKLEDLEEAKKKLERENIENVFTEICEYTEEILALSDKIAMIDCLLNLYTISTSLAGSMCRPTFISNKKSPILELRGVWNPGIIPKKYSNVNNFIPNDIILGTKSNNSTFIIVTGPNMGGKSTILRTTAIAVIFAQIGCYVPAQSCILTPVDKIFTRIGANDAILANKSTFYVELSETSNILKNSTINSLVILDELGRGTTTTDGISIAYSVIEHLSKIVKCRTLFSTHYHKLTKYYMDSDLVSLYYMSFKIENKKQKIIFLYKFIKGICYKSYGLNCAKLAGLPDDIITKAIDMSNKLEKNQNIFCK